MWYLGFSQFSGQWKNTPITLQTTKLTEISRGRKSSVFFFIFCSFCSKSLSQSLSRFLTVVSPHCLLFHSHSHVPCLTPAANPLCRWRRQECGNVELVAKEDLKFPECWLAAQTPWHWSHLLARMSECWQRVPEPFQPRKAAESTLCLSALETRD